MKKILILSRDAVFSGCARVMLEDGGFSCSVHSETPPDTAFYDAILLDLETVKPSSFLYPVIFTSYGEPPSDCDVFLSRPFRESELISTADSVCTGESDEKPERFILDPIRRRVSFNGESIPLTHREFELLSLLINTDGAVSREEIIQAVFGGTATGNADAVYVNYLRKKLEKLCGKNPIVSVRGYGYKFKFSNSI